MLPCGEVDTSSAKYDGSGSDGSVVGAFLQSLARHAGCDKDDPCGDGEVGANCFDDGGGEDDPCDERDGFENGFDDGGGEDHSRNEHDDGEKAPTIATARSASARQRTAPSIVLAFAARAAQRAAWAAWLRSARRLRLA